jgi:hypothetical protein
VRLSAWQLPELLRVVAVADASAPEDLGLVESSEGGVAVPIVPEVC